MNQPEWMKRWQRRVIPEAREDALRVAPRQHRRLAGSSYQPLHAYLEHRYADTAVLTFEQIESLLGFALPDRARTHDEWWAGDGADVVESGHEDAWRLAGRTATPNLQARTVAFVRVSP